MSGLRVSRHLAIWTAVGLLISSQMMMSARYVQGSNPSWFDVLLSGLAVAHMWGLVSLVIQKLVRSNPLDRHFLWKGFPAHLVLLLSFVLVYGLFCAAFFVEDMQGEPYIDRFWFCVSMTFHAQLMIYVVIAALFYALEFQRQNRKREQQLARMQVELSQAKLDKLRSQLHPHFLFNTLNTVTALIEDDPDNAIRVTSRLSDLLRIALETGDKDTVALQDELGFISKYVDIQQIRFGSRLKYQQTIDENVKLALVPALMLQPLVENAVMHAVAAGPGDCQIKLQAKRDGDDLCLEIEDSGAGSDSNPPKPNLGIGLANTRNRLAHMFGDRGKFQLKTSPQGGTTVSLILPLQFQSAQ